MIETQVTILKGVAPTAAESNRETVWSFEELKKRATSGALFGDFRRYSTARLLTARIGAFGKPLITAVLLRWLARGKAWIEDAHGQRRAIGLAAIAGLFRNFLRDFARKGRVVRSAYAMVNQLASAETIVPQLDLSASPVYVRTDLWFGVRAGGSVGHIAGVLNNLASFAGPAVFLTSDPIATVSPRIDTNVIVPREEFWDFTGIPAIAFNRTFVDAAARILNGHRIAFLYQRYSTDNYAGLIIARSRQVPFVLEYNGSEVWINRNWGTPLRYEDLAIRIETLNLQAADLIVVVSEPMRAELVARGVQPKRILVNPNGVDTTAYSPEVDDTAVRARLGLLGKTVIGFIGTFGPWHGAEILADAFGRLIMLRPELRSSIRLLMVGDGAKMHSVQEVIERHGIADICVLTGLVPQADGPRYLATCDILASPHVPNADGTPFFGSPTKLFEYMAMGRAIVASNLDQIGDVLRDRETAIMTVPGDPDDLARGLAELVDDAELRARLGAAARLDAVANHSWRDHTRRIVEALQEVCK